MPIINQDISSGSVTTPSAGNTTFFTDAGAAYLKLPSGAVNPVGAGTVSSVNASSSTLDVSGGPITSSGSLTINLPTQGGVTPGDYTSANISVDAQGRVTAVANGSSGSGSVGNNYDIQFGDGSGGFRGSNNFKFAPNGSGMGPRFSQVIVGYNSGVGPVSGAGDGFFIAGTDIFNTNIGLCADTNGLGIRREVLSGSSPGTALITWPGASGTDATFASTVTGGLITNNAAPASAGATGTAGMISYDASFIYVCVATDTWVRASLATW